MYMFISGWKSLRPQEPVTKAIKTFRQLHVPGRGCKDVRTSRRQVQNARCGICPVTPCWRSAPGRRFYKKLFSQRRALERAWEDGSPKRNRFRSSVFGGSILVGDTYDDDAWNGRCSNFVHRCDESFFQLAWTQLAWT